MPFTDYKVIVGTNAEELTRGVIDGGLVPIGDLDPSTADYALQAAGIGTGVLGFEVVQATTTGELEDAVNERLALGLQPVGGVFHWHRAFLQAMGKPSAGGGSSGGGGADIPTGKSYQVLGYNAAGTPAAGPIRMDQWLGEDRQIGGTAAEFIPVTYLLGGGQKASQGTPNLRGLSSSAQASSVASRDSGGVLSGATATNQTHLPNLKQVQEMIAEVSSPEGVTGTEYQVAGFDKTAGAMKPISFRLEQWTGAVLPRLDAAVEWIPTAHFAAGGVFSSQGTRHLDEMPNRFSVALRDMNGRLSAETAYLDYQLTNLKQVRDLIAASRKEIEDGIFDIINGGGAK